MTGTGSARRWLMAMAGVVLAATVAVWDGSAQSKQAPETPKPEKSIGRKTAPITMEVFSDYQCPACRDLYFQTLRPVIENYVNTGKVYLIQRDMPLPIHQYSRLAARYANAAATLNRLDKVTLALYEKQNLWSADGNVEAVVAAVLTPAEMRRARQLVEGGTLEPHINSDVARGNTKRVRSTPTTLISYGGQEVPVVGVVPYSMMRQFLDELLKKVQ